MMKRFSVYLRRSRKSFVAHVVRPAFTLGVILVIALLAGCGAGLTETVLPDGQTAPVDASRTTAPQERTSPAMGEATESAAATLPQETAPLPAATPFEPRSDAQGAVEVIVAPSFNPGETSSLDFKITLDTHSVDLVFDLASLAELKTDTGVTLQPLQWDAPSGGHHVEGVLSFPAQVDGKPALDGARQFILTIKNLDSPLRTFTWEW